MLETNLNPMVVRPGGQAWSPIYRRRAGLQRVGTRTHIEGL